MPDVIQFNRPPSKEEYQKHLAELSKQNAVGGMTDLTPSAFGLLASPSGGALLQNYPKLVALLGVLSSDLNNANTKAYRKKSKPDQYDEKSIAPDPKYEKSLKSEKAAKQAIEALQKERSY